MSVNLRKRVGGKVPAAVPVQPKITDTFKEAKVVRRKSVKVKDAENAHGLIKSSEEGPLCDARRALHISTPVALPCRDEQIGEVYEFIRGTLEEGRAGSMYISGAPGTGKTAVVKHVLDNLKGEEDGKLFSFVQVFVNCMNLREPSGIFEVVAKALNIKEIKGVDLIEKISNRAVNKRAKPAVIVLDEMDQLLAGSKEILYRAFEWTRIPGSKFILIGIANSLDLTVRHIPLLTASPKSMSPKPRTPAGLKSQMLKQQVTPAAPQPSKLMQFPPYDRSDIEKILESRMTELGSHVFDPTAIKFVAAKVSATTGDMRKALNACQNALEASEKSQRPVLKATADDGFNTPSSPKKMRTEDKIGIAAMSKILAPKKDDGALPLQQKLILATLLKINKEAGNSVNIPQDGVTAPIPLTAFYETYRKICSEKSLSWIDRSELSSICGLLEDRSLVHVSEGGCKVGTKKVKSVKGAKGSGIFFQAHAVSSLVRNDPLVTSIVG